MITGIAHNCYTVKDIEESIKFYTEIIGFNHAFDFRNDEGVRVGVYLKTGKGRSFIELFQAGADASRQETGIGYQHICLEVDSVNKTKSELEAKGIKTTDPLFGMDNSWQIWLDDPDGNKIELHEYTKDSYQAPHLD